jgi:DNA-binding response OmpR family regulator
MTKEKVLIADADRQLVDALAMRVRKLGLEVRIAHDAVAALKMTTTCRTFRPV